MCEWSGLECERSVVVMDWGNWGEQEGTLCGGVKWERCVPDGKEDRGTSWVQHVECGEDFGSLV